MKNTFLLIAFWNIFLFMRVSGAQTGSSQVTKFGRIKLLTIDETKPILENLLEYELIEINPSVLQSLIKKNSTELKDYILLVTFYNENCAECQSFLSYFELALLRAKAAQKKMLFFLINVIYNPDSFELFKLDKLPSVYVGFVVFVSGNSPSLLTRLKMTL